MTTVREGRAAGAADGGAVLAEWIGTDRARWATLTSWAVSASLGDLVRATTPEASVGVSDAWAAPVAITRVVCLRAVFQPGPTITFFIHVFRLSDCAGRACTRRLPAITKSSWSDPKG